jgi:HEAT repeat protein
MRSGFCFLAVVAAISLASGCQKNVDPDEELLQLLKHNDSSQRVTAAVIIRDMRPVPEKFIKPLLEALNDNEPQVRQTAADALGEIGIAGRPFLTQIGQTANTHFDPQVRMSLDRAFQRINADQ